MRESMEVEAKEVPFLELFTELAIKKFVDLPGLQRLQRPQRQGRPEPVGVSRH